ncbi:MAG: YdcF family protein [Lachnospiraceae bacterium]|nr:YdcF family protein [Lachnospiraceae bacterium]
MENITVHFLEIAGAFCLLYFIFIMIYVGLRPSFHYVWLAAGIFLRAGAWILGQSSQKALPFWVCPVWLTFAGIIGAMGIMVLVAEGFIFSKMWAVPHKPVKYVIVLGACVRGTRVTRSLAYRLKKAAEYAEKHKECILVVSGGQGPGEDITEALAMKRYLERLGMEGDRILLEERSVNTRENLMFSREIIQRYESGAGESWDSNLNIAVCSNNFHMYRAMALARAAGNWKVEGLAAMTDPFMWLSFTLREGAALIKEQIRGHI